MKETRLLVCSDLHGSEDAMNGLGRLAAAEEFDAIVVCGDFTTYGSLDYMRKFLKTFEAKVLAVPGNCDTRDTVGVLERAGASIHARAQELDGLRFFGFGGAPPSPHNMPFEVDEAEMEKGLRSGASEQGVMVTHAPAFGMNDRNHKGRNSGIKGFLRVAEEFRPRLALSGHFHESRGQAASGGTVFVNPGAARDGAYAIVTVGPQVRVELACLDLAPRTGLKSF